MNDKEHRIKPILEAIISKAAHVNNTLDNLQSQTRTPDASILVNSSFESLKSVF